MNLNEELEKREAAGLVRSQRLRDHRVWCYTNQCVYEKAWDEITRQARGIVTRDDGEILCRTFPKFFNLNEVDETRLENLPRYQPYVMNKIDGSLLNVWHDGEHWRCSTKGSLDNEYISYAHNYLGFNDAFKKLSRECTYVFEVVMPNDQMHRVVMHEPGLHYLTKFHTLSGIEHAFGEPPFGHRVTREEKSLEDIDHAQEGVEGWVLYWPGENLRVKVKTSWYLGIFRLLNEINEDRIKTMILEGGGDDSWSKELPEEFRIEVEAQTAAIRARYDREAQRLERLFAEHADKDRKEFAMAVKDDPRSFVLFNMKDGKPFREKLLKHI